MQVFGERFQAEPRRTSWLCWSAWNLPVPNIQWKTPHDRMRRFPKYIEFYNIKNLSNWWVRCFFKKNCWQSEQVLIATKGPRDYALNPNSPFFKKNWKTVIKEILELHKQRDDIHIFRFNRTSVYYKANTQTQMTRIKQENTKLNKQKNNMAGNVVDKNPKL